MNVVVSSVCKGNTVKGNRCIRKTKNENGFCYYHSPKKNNEKKSSVDTKVTTVCKGTTSKGVRCKQKTKNKDGFCYRHISQFEVSYKYEKPDACIVCLESMDDQNEPLTPCSHWVHFECVNKWGGEICPICRGEITNKEIVRKNKEDDGVREISEDEFFQIPSINRPTIASLGRDPGLWCYASELMPVRLYIHILYGGIDYMMEDAFSIASRLVVMKFLDPRTIISFISENLNTADRDSILIMENVVPVQEILRNLMENEDELVD